VALASKGLVSCAQYSYRFPLGHPNFAKRPTRFGSNKKKLNPAIGIGELPHACHQVRV